MSPKFDLSSIWRNVKEIDLQRIRKNAEREVRIGITGGHDADRQALANHLRSDPRRPDALSHATIPLLDLSEAAGFEGLDLILLILDPEPGGESAQEELLKSWGRDGQRAILIRPVVEGIDNDMALLDTRFPVAGLDLDDWSSVQRALSPRILEALPAAKLALGRSFPLLRETVARDLIAETCTANAAYAFSTGLAEIVPVLDLPLNIADMIVLSKAQALLVYKLGLALGLPQDWQYYLTEFSGVIGSGFLWRQAARSLVGLIPAWGIVPKVAVAYSGTYAVGHGVLLWYLTGRQVTRKMLRGLMREAFQRGKSIGKGLRARVRASRRPKTLELPVGSEENGGRTNTIICTLCSTINDPDAHFCKNCGKALIHPGR